VDDGISPQRAWLLGDLSGRDQCLPSVPHRPLEVEEACAVVADRESVSRIALAHRV